MVDVRSYKLKWHASSVGENDPKMVFLMSSGAILLSILNTYCISSAVTDLAAPKGFYLGFSAVTLSW